MQPIYVRKNVPSEAPEPVLDQLVKDSRTGPRDILLRLLNQYSEFPDLPITVGSLEKTIGKYGDACFEQMIGAYELHILV